MTTDFFIKKWGYIGLSCLCVLFSLCIFFYAAFIHRAQSVWHGKSFYFLLSPTEHIEVGIFDAQLDGGAGYLLNDNGREVVVLAAYLNKADAVTAQASVSGNFELLNVSVERLYFKTWREKRNADSYQSALSALYNCMQILEQEIYRLDNGATQNSSISVLKILQRQFAYMDREYARTYHSFSEICKKTAMSLEKIVSDIVFASDLRYLLCELTVGYIELTKNFSL